MTSSSSKEAEPWVSVQDLHLSYVNREGLELSVLSGLSIELRKGELLSLIGPSGCGKTSLLHVLMGLEPARAGSIVCRASSRALVFQKPQLLPWRDVLGNTAYGLECRGVPLPEARERAVPLLSRMGLDGHLYDHPHQLSEGMKQRVNLARALLVEPELLLMDEPFAALDALTRRQLQDELLEIWQGRGLTILFVSHSLEEVVYLSDRVGVLSEKPTRLKRIEPIDLAHPRGATAEAMLGLFEKAQALRSLLLE